VTEKAFSGNPAGVCVTPGGTDDRWMQNVAEEMNLAETAFLTRRKEGYDLRWFTPTVEVDLCGHATLASAHVLWESGALAPGEQARFHTRSGVLTADRRGELIELDFPATPDAPAPPAPGLLSALGIGATYVGKSIFDYIVEVENEGTLLGMRPDLAALRLIPARGVMVTCRSGSPDYDFVSRFFAPASGVDEDPVTGSAHCCLAPFWAKRLQKNSLVAFQASKRGGLLHLRLEGERVKLSGKALTVFRGELLS
jgi:PhzF family phenazine biosynthesis protein